jgi:hypothetical protein
MDKSRKHNICLVIAKKKTDEMNPEQKRNVVFWVVYDKAMRKSGKEIVEIVKKLED